MKFSEQVKQVRATLFLTQSQIAKEIGVSYASVNRWENGIEPQFLTKAKFYKFCKEHNIVFSEE